MMKIIEKVAAKEFKKLPKELQKEIFSLDFLIMERNVDFLHVVLAKSQKMVG